MMATIEQNCEGCTIHSPDKKLTWTKHILGLVDDARQYANDWNDNNMVQIQNYLQHSSQTWEHLLHTTGGKLEIPKCAIYTLEWDFDEQGIPFLQKHTTSSINIQSSETKTKQLIPHLPNDAPFKYLGVHTSPNGCQKKQSDVTFKTAQDGARILASKPFSHFQARIYLNSHLNMKLYFPLTTSSLPEAQYTRINKAHIPQALSSMGFNKTWPIALRFGCHPYGGLQLKHIEVEALIRKLRSVHDLLHKDDTSKAVKLLFHWYQTAAGISHPVLEMPNQSTEYVNSKWTNDLIRMLAKYHVKIKLPDTNIQKLQRFNDKFIMDDILSSISSTKIRRQLNACRLFLQITFISELTNIDGTHLITGILKGDNSKMSTTTRHWPKQGSPTHSTWKVWSKVITQLYCVKPHSTILRKENKLGHWLTSHSSRTQSHQFSYSPSHQEIYEQTTQGNKQWFATAVRASIFHTDKATEQTCDMIPNDSFPIKKILITLFA